VLVQVIAYGIAGFGYIITATFLPVIARQALPGSAWPDYFWPIFGLSVALGAFSATRLSVQGDQRLLLTGAYLMQAAGCCCRSSSPCTGFRAELPAAGPALHRHHPVRHARGAACARNRPAA
jgi:hypothetical protein